MSDTVRMTKIPACDFPHIEETPAAVDGKTKQGPWAYMCTACFNNNGLGIGTGRGQRLVLDEGDVSG